MTMRRMSHQDIFLEIKRALHPLGNDTLPYRPTDESLWYESARSQMANVNVEDEQDDYLKVGGLLYSWISLKDLPDATFPGILRELVVMDCPLVVNAEVTLPDQSKSIKQYKSRLRKMLAAQKDFHGGFRINVDAQVAEHQLVKVLQDLISSSLKACQMSLIVTTRTSQPSRNRMEREEAERILSDRRQRLLHAIARMNGGRGIPETLAQKRLFFTGLPAMGGENRRELDLLTLNAADLLPVEMPWRGTQHSPLMLFETPYRQLVPFSPFDSSLGDANMLIMAKSGGGKTFMAQLFLLMMARANPQISIIERGDSYQPLVDLMGGRVIDVKLDGAETLNPWDLPAGETTPSKEKIAFLKNLTRHMIGDSPGSDNSLVDNLLSDAIGRTYKRCAIRYSNPIPTFNDLREELAQWRDEERMQRTIDEARLAAIKLRSWTGEKGIYAKLFDAHTTMRLDSNWLFFNVEGLSSDPKLETAMSMLIANAVASRAGGKTGQPSITVLDECWFLLDSPTLAPEVVQLFRTARKRNASVWGISQTVEDFVGTEFQPREHGPGILKNASTKIIGQQPGDMTPLVNHLFLNPVALNEVKRFSAPRKGESADALLGPGREGRDDPDDPDRSNGSRLLGLHDIPERTTLPRLGPEEVGGPPAARRVSGIGPKVSSRLSRGSAVAGRDFGCSNGRSVMKALAVDDLSSLAEVAPSCWAAVCLSVLLLATLPFLVDAFESGARLVHRLVSPSKRIVGGVSMVILTERSCSDFSSSCSPTG